MIDFKNKQEILDTADLIYSAEEIDTALNRVAKEMTAELKDSFPLLLCVMTGGVPFAADMMKKLNFPLEFDYLHVTRYGQETSGGGLSWRSAPWTSVKDRTVVILDDILDEGITLYAIIEKLTEMGAKKCYTAVATDKENGKVKPLKADFVALSLPNRYVFGYGMDVSGAWRNLPAIYAVKGM